MMSIRSKRRNRWRQKVLLNQLDQIAVARINKSYMAATSTWGGHRCPDCGIQVRPHCLQYPGEAQLIEGDKVVGFLTVGVTPPCDIAKECKGEIDWQGKAAERACKRLAHERQVDFI